MDGCSETESAKLVSTEQESQEVIWNLKRKGKFQKGRPEPKTKRRETPPKIGKKASSVNKLSADRKRGKKNQKGCLIIGKEGRSPAGLTQREDGDKSRKKKRVLINKKRTRGLILGRGNWPCRLGGFEPGEGNGPSQ